MVFAADERGQSVLVGTILLFGILIIAFSSYQAFVVPNQNAEVEFNHNSEAQSDMQDLRNSLTDIRSVRRGSIVSEHRSVRIQMGTSYPSRLIALNPPRPSGTLTTVEPNSEVEIRDATIENEDDFQEDADLDEIFESHPTTFLSYRPNYNEYGNAPNTNLEHSLLYNDFGDRTLTVADQNVVSANSNQITLILYDGDFTRSSSQSQTLAPRTVDGPTDPVELEPDNDELRLTLPTNARERWEASLEDIDHATVNDGESSDDEVVLDLDVGELEDVDSYKLRMARVSFDGQGTGQPEVFTSMQYEEDAVTGPPGVSLRDAEVEDIDSDEEVDQDFEFTLNRALSGDEKITIDLEDPQGPNQVDYGGATADVDTSGDIEFTEQSNNDAELTYTADGSEQEDDSITIEVESIDASGSQAVNRSPYDVVFEGPDGDTIDRSFSVDD